MSAKLADHGKTIIFGVSLNGMGDVRYPVAYPGLLNTDVEAGPGRCKQVLQSGVDWFNSQGKSTISVVAFEQDPDIDTDNVSLVQASLTG